LKHIIAETTDAPIFRGGMLALWESKHHECLLSGPYQTGKTYGALSKLHALLCLFPNCYALMVRKTRNSILTSAVVTYMQKVLPFPPGHDLCPIEKYGGERPEFFLYPNGSRLAVGGLDDADKYLSAEYDFIYVNQAEEITLDAWEKLVGRATGRAGNAPWTQVFGDCNPGPPNHWIKNRAALQLLETRHEDNPSLHDGQDWTELGRKSLKILDGLTGLRYKRGRLGLWVGAEGVVYEFDPTIHLIPPFEIPVDWQRIMVCDFGFVNPFVALWIAFDEDRRMYVYRQLYMTQRTVTVHAAQIKEYSKGERYAVTIADHDAEDRATLHENGIQTIAADKRVTVGIEKVQERLKVQADGKPRLFVLEDGLIEIDQSLLERRHPLCIEDEFPVYTYPEGKDGKPVKEEPVKMYDHSLDALRYAVAWADTEGDTAMKQAAIVGRPTAPDLRRAVRRAN
jgi:PBSX family phage terminase large subunit